MSLERQPSGSYSEFSGVLYIDYMAYFESQPSCPYFNTVVAMGTTGIKDTHTASLYEIAFTATPSVSGRCCEVK